MAMCTSGSLSICATAGSCRSIAAAVTSSSSGNLGILSIAAGKSAPHCMREFYGYAAISLCVNPNSITFAESPINCNICICATAGLSWQLCISVTDNWINVVSPAGCSGTGNCLAVFGTTNYSGVRNGTICVTSTQPTANISVSQGTI